MKKVVVAVAAILLGACGEEAVVSADECVNRLSAKTP